MLCDKIENEFSPHKNFGRLEALLADAALEVLLLPVDGGHVAAQRWNLVERSSEVRS